MKIRTAALALVLVAAHASPAFAAPPDEDAAVTARLAFLEAVLARDGAKLGTWRDAWVSTFAALALLQVGVGVPTTDVGVRGAAFVGGIKSLLAAGSILAVPATIVTASARLGALDARTPEERRAKLLVAESLLQKSAAESRFRHSWMPLVAGALLNVGGAAVMWAGYHRPGSGWFGLGSGLVVGQLFYQTQPIGAIAAWDAYSRARDQGKPPPTVASLAAKEPAIRWSVAPGAGGVLLQGSF
jgi:hypothetical protein